MGTDLSEGIPAAAVQEGQMIGGEFQGKPVLIARSGGQLFAIGAKCTHYGGPLAGGIVVNDTARCPWPHACLCLETGGALPAPALGSVDCFDIRGENAQGVLHGKGSPQARPE